MSITSDYYFTILKQLLDIVTKETAGITGFPVRDDDETKADSSMQNRLYAGIRDGRFRSDSDASMELYAAPPSDQRYQTLRTRAIDHLLSEIRHIDLSIGDYSEYATNYYRCLDIFRAAALMAMKSNLPVAEYALSRALSIAKKYDFTELEYIIRSYLSANVLLKSDDMKSREHHIESFRLLRTMYYEHVAESSYEALYVVECDFSFTPFVFGEQTSLNRHQALQLLESIDPQYRSYKVVLNHYRALVDFHVSYDDFFKAEQVLVKWMQLYTDHPHFLHRSRIGEIKIMKLNFALLARRPDSLKQFENPSRYFTLGKTNWCLATILTILAHLYRNDYENSLNTYLELRDNYSDMVYATDVYEYRMLLEAYLWIATTIMEPELFGHTNPNAEIPFRLTTFLNAMRLFTADKQSTNALIVIAHAFILLIQDKDQDAAYRRVSHLNVYASRYLKGETEERLLCCVKAIQKILTHRYRPRELRNAIAPFIRRIQELESLPMKSGINEIIRWDALLTAYVDWEERRQRQLDE